jgi:copper chaperone NosL
MRHTINKSPQSATLSLDRHQSRALRRSPDGEGWGKGALACVRALAFACLFGGSLASCDSEESLSAPDVLYGQQECVHCRMIISDERFAAGMIIERADGSRETLAFDDINCMFDQERACDGCTVLMRYVHDVNTRQWLEASGAAFMISKTLETPMASGVAAAASRGALLDLQQQHAGELLDFAAIARRFINPTQSARATQTQQPEGH